MISNKKKQKKGLRQISNGFSGQIQVISEIKKKGFLHNFLPISPSLTPISFGGGLFSFLDQKSASKLLKSRYFAYFSGQWRGLEAPTPPPPLLATLLVAQVELENFMQNFV